MEWKEKNRGGGEQGIFERERRKKGGVMLICGKRLGVN